MNDFTDPTAIENGAGIARITCGWKKPHLALEPVRGYWRDVHSPAISRRPGLYEYRHYQFEAVDASMFAPVTGIVYHAEANQQLMWLSDVRYRNQAALELSTATPAPEVRAKILGDIDLLVDQSTTYKSVGADAHTFIDRTGNATPAGPARAGSVSVFFRQRGADAAFAQGMRALAARWAAAPGVLRVRLSMFEAPDMDAERKAGYPIKTHAKALQYQAWIDLVMETDAVAQTLMQADDATFIATLHAYPLYSLYTFVYNARPTLAALRGYAAHAAIEAFGATHQTDHGLLSWMYGPIVDGIQPEEDQA